MKNYETIGSPRYYIESGDGNFHFDVFKKKENAIASALQLALDFPKQKFMVNKKFNHKTKKIFSIQINMEHDITDFKCVFEKMKEASSKKLEKATYWRSNK